MRFKPHQSELKLESVNKFMKWIKLILEEVKTAIWKSQDNMTKYYN